LITVAEQQHTVQVKQRRNAIMKLNQCIIQCNAANASNIDPSLCLKIRIMILDSRSRQIAVRALPGISQFTPTTYHRKGHYNQINSHYSQEPL